MISAVHSIEVRGGGFPSFCFIVAATLGAAVLLPFVLPLGDLFLYFREGWGHCINDLCLALGERQNFFSGALGVVMASTLAASVALSVLFRSAFPACHLCMYVCINSHSSS
jgi:hypothetical protein